MGKALVTMTNAHVTGMPTYFPDPNGNAQKNQLIMNLTVNGRKRKDGTRSATTIAAKVWGKYANIAAHQLRNGSAVNITGELSTWRRDTGKVEAGKRMFEERITINMDSFEHAGATNKELIERLSLNSAAFNTGKAAGTIRPDAVLTPEIMLKTPDPIVVPDFNIVLAAQTGMYGNARVWTKDRGFLGSNKAVAAVAVAAPQDQNAAIASLASLVAQVQNLVKNAGVANVVAAEPVSDVPAPVDVFAAAGV